MLSGGVSNPESILDLPHGLVFPVLLNVMCTRVSDDGGRSLEACPTISVSLVVPVYNEAETVGLFLDRVDRMVASEPTWKSSS